MQNLQYGNRRFFFYDPSIRGYDPDYFQTITGDITRVNNKIRVRKGISTSGRANSTFSFLFGELTYAATIPTAPTAGDERYLGFYSRALGNRNSAYFFISGTNFYTRTYSADSDVVDQTTIAWNASWTNVSTEFTIIWRISTVEFWVGGLKVAVHGTKIPKQRMMPLYFSTNLDDDFYISWTEVRNAREILYNNPLNYPISFSPSISASISPSLSPSISPSLSPSISPSISPSLSPSLSPSISPSVSPSVSLSPSISPSVSPSVSLSPSISPSISPSVSPSLSPSISPSISPSPSA